MHKTVHATQFHILSLHRPTHAWMKYTSGTCITDICDMPQTSVSNTC